MSYVNYDVSKTMLAANANVIANLVVHSLNRHVSMCERACAINLSHTLADPVFEQSKKVERVRFGAGWGQRIYQVLILLAFKTCAVYFVLYYVLIIVYCAPL